jgi:hypothetical protein
VNAYHSNLFSCRPILKRGTPDKPSGSANWRKLSHALGDIAWREIGLGAPTDVDVLQQRITSLDSSSSTSRLGSARLGSPRRAAPRVMTTSKPPQREP